MSIFVVLCSFFFYETQSLQILNFYVSFYLLNQQVIDNLFIVLFFFLDIYISTLLLKLINKRPFLFHQTTTTTNLHPSLIELWNKTPSGGGNLNLNAKPKPETNTQDYNRIQKWKHINNIKTNTTANSYSKPKASKLNPQKPLSHEHELETTKTKNL